jgi:hypothetical protein
MAWIVPAGTTMVSPFVAECRQRPAISHPDRRAQFLWCEVSFQSDGNLRARLCREDASFGLAVRQSD